MWFTALLGLLPSVFTTINGITSAIANAQIAKVNATTDQDRIAAQATVDTLTARRDVMIAESGHSNVNAWLRAAIAVGPACYLLKIFLWDKVMGSITNGSTDPLDGNLWAVVTAVVGFYFLYDATTTVARIIKA
jgi:hypothetical protein